jgi:uncharacterized membrane protein
MTMIIPSRASCVTCIWRQGTALAILVSAIAVGRTITTMKETQQLNQKQREEFKEALRTIYRKASEVLSEKSTEAHEIALQKVLAHQKAVDLAASYKDLKAKLEKTEKLLEQKGFEIGYGDVVRLDSHAPDSLKAMYEAFVSEQVGPERQRVDELNKAVSNSWSIATLAEAKELLASFAQ